MSLLSRTMPPLCGAMLVAAGLAPSAVAAPLIVDTGTVELSDVDSPHDYDGVSVGSALGQSGTLIVNPDAVLNNNGGFVFDDPDGIGFRVGARIPFNNPPDGSSGTVIFESGSTFNNTGSVYIGWTAEKQGFVTLEEGATWSNSGRPNHFDFSVVNGELNIQGTLTSDTPAGIGGGDSAIVRVSGAGGLWEVGNSLDVSSVGGTARLEITDGGTVTSTISAVGFSNLGTGEVIVGNAGSTATSTWSVGPNLIDLGAFSNAHGTLTVEENGLVEAGRMLLGRSGGEGHIVANSGGAVVVNNFFRSVELWETSTIDVSGGGKMQIGAGNLALQDDGTLRVGAGGLLKGSGTIIGDLVLAGGIVAPGHSPGVMTIDGDFIFDSGVLEIEIEAGEADLFIVTGDLFLGAGATIELAFGFDPGDATFDLADFFQVAGTFTVDDDFDLGESLTVTGIDDPAFTIALLDRSFTFGDQGEPGDGGEPGDPTAVDEPPSLALLGLALVGLVAARRRRARA